MQHDKDPSDQDDDLSLDEAQKATLQWLMEREFSEPTERLFTLADDSYTEDSLTEAEAAVASRHMYGSSGDGDELSALVEEEIIMTSVGDSSDIYAQVQEVEIVESPAPAAEVAMTIDHSGSSKAEAAKAVVIADGTDILGLSDEDDIGLQFLTLKRTAPVAAVSAAQDSQPSTQEQPPQQAVGDTSVIEPTAQPAENSSDVQEDAPSMESPAPEVTEEVELVELALQSEEQLDGLELSLEQLTNIAGTESESDEPMAVLDALELSLAVDEAASVENEIPVAMAADFQVDFDPLISPSAAAEPVSDDADAFWGAISAVELAPVETSDTAEAAEVEDSEGFDKTTELSDLAELGDVEETAELDETIELSAAAELEDLADLGEAAELSELAELVSIEETAELDEAIVLSTVAEVEDLADLGEAAELSELAELGSIEETAELDETFELSVVAELEDLADLGEAAELSELAELDGIEETAELDEAIEPSTVAEVEDLADLSEAAELSELAELDGIEETAELDEAIEPSTVAEVEDLADLGEAAELSELAELGSIEETAELDEATEPSTVAEVEDLAELDEAAELAEVAELGEVEEITELAKAGEREETVDTNEAVALAEVPELAEIAPASEVVEPETSAKPVEGDVFDYVAANKPPVDEAEFDRYLLHGEHLQGTGSTVEDLVVQRTEGVASVDPSEDVSIDYHQDFHDIAALDGDAISIAAITLAIPDLMQEIYASVQDRLAILAVDADGVGVEVMLGDDLDAIIECVAEGYAPVLEICPQPPAALTKLNGAEVDVVYIRLTHAEQVTGWNRLLWDDFVPPTAELAASVAETEEVSAQDSVSDDIESKLQQEDSDSSGNEVLADISEIAPAQFETDLTFPESVLAANTDTLVELEADDASSDQESLDAANVSDEIEPQLVDLDQGSDEEAGELALSDHAEELAAPDVEELTASLSEEALPSSDVFNLEVRDTGDELEAVGDSQVANTAEPEQVAELVLAADEPQPGEPALVEPELEQTGAELDSAAEDESVEAADEERIEADAAVFDEDIFSADFADELPLADEAAAVDVEALFEDVGNELLEESEGDICGVDVTEFADSGEIEMVPEEDSAVAAAASASAEGDMSWCIPGDIVFSHTSRSSSEIFMDFLDSFLEDGVTEIERLEDAIGEWEEDVSSEAVYEPIPRALHNLKGIAKGVGLQRYGTLVHNFETLLDSLARPEPGHEQAYFRIVNAWLDAAVRGFEHIQDDRSDVASEFPERGTAPVVTESDSEPVTLEPAETEQEIESSVAKVIPLEQARKSVPSRERQQDKDLADEGAKALAAQQTIRMTAESLDHLLNLTNQSQQLGVRSSQSTVRSKRAAAELMTRLSSVRAHIANIADKALRNVTAKGGQSSTDLDALEMDQYSELQEAANILREGVEDLDDLIRLSSRQSTLAEALLKQQASVVSSLGSAIQSARVVPVSRLMPSLRRIVRTVGADLGKAVSFRVLNQVGSLDRDNFARCQTILEHMVRNALDHGIESVEARAAAGKPQSGRITIDVKREGSDYIITLDDDGKGIDPHAIREVAYKKGLDVDVAALTDDEARRLIFHKGLSTASTLSEISGRGVGMDIVLSELQQIGGDIQIESEVGVGTSFHIRIPSNVTVNGALLVTAGETSYAIPLGGLIAIEHVPVEIFFTAIGEGETLPLFGMDCTPAYLGTLCQGEALPDPSSWTGTVPVMIAGSEDRYMAIAIDDVKQALELVIRSLGVQFSMVPGVAGATTTADGQAIVALDLNALVHSFVGDNMSPIFEKKVEEERLLVLVVDDSRTQRMVSTSQFDTLGVETITAENGMVAIDLLNATHRLPDIVLLDVEMPVKDGIQTLREIRHSSRYGHIPVIMVTSRTGEKHRALAREAGCNGYMGKPFNFPLLVEEIAQLTGRELNLS